MTDIITPLTNLMVTPGNTASLASLFPKLALYFTWADLAGTYTNVSKDWVDRVRGLTYRHANSYKDATGVWVNGVVAATFPAGTMPDFNGKHVVAFFGAGAAGSDVTTRTMSFWDKASIVGGVLLPVTQQAASSYFTNDGGADYSFIDNVSSLTLTAASPLATVGYANFTSPTGENSRLFRACKGKTGAVIGTYTFAGSGSFTKASAVTHAMAITDGGLQATQTHMQSIGIFLFDKAPDPGKLATFAQLLSIWPDKLPTFFQGSL